MDGSNSLLFYFLEIVNKELKDVSLFRELINKKNFQYKINFGKAINPSDLSSNIESDTQYLQNLVEFDLGQPPSIV
jgi:putative hemolysin